MCASALRQLHIRRVFFGCLNDRFGGNGGVLNIHTEEKGGVDPPYPAVGGIFNEEAIMMLRRFYVQENERAPDPAAKGGRELKTGILPFGVERFRILPNGNRDTSGLLRKDNDTKIKDILLTQEEK